jgi:hypothetical protein
VHIGAALTALMYLLPPALKKLRTEHLGIDLLVWTGVTRDAKPISAMRD